MVLVGSNWRLSRCQERPVNPIDLRNEMNLPEQVKWKQRQRIFVLKGRSLRYSDHKTYRGLPRGLGTIRDARTATMRDRWTLCESTTSIWCRHGDGSAFAKSHAIIDGIAFPTRTGCLRSISGNSNGFFFVFCLGTSLYIIYSCVPQRAVLETRRNTCALLVIKKWPKLSMLIRGKVRSCLSCSCYCRAFGEGSYLHFS